jgi:hypothetical protein
MPRASEERQPQRLASRREGLKRDAFYVNAGPGLHGSGSGGSSTTGGGSGRGPGSSPDPSAHRQTLSDNYLDRADNGEDPDGEAYSIHQYHGATGKTGNIGASPFREVREEGVVHAAAEGGPTDGKKDASCRIRTRRRPCREQ